MINNIIPIILAGFGVFNVINVSMGNVHVESLIVGNLNYYLTIIFFVTSIVILITSYLLRYRILFSNSVFAVLITLGLYGFLILIATIRMIIKANGRPVIF